MIRSFAASLVTLAFLATSASAQIHVDRGIATPGDGSSWAQAFRSLEEAFAVSAPGSEVWVKAGVYKPRLATEPTDPRTRTFNLPVDIRLFGGFDGTETNLAQRAGLFSSTILSGDIGVQGDASDNAYHVVSAMNLPPTQFGEVLIDGFTIRDGNANYSGTGAALKTGGGLYVFNVYGRVLVRNCIFTQNNAVRGGAIGTQLGYLNMVQTRFSRNTATNGGALHIRTSSFVGWNLVFDSNSATVDGGAVFVANTGGSNWACTGLPGGGVLYNNLFHRNSAGGDGGAVHVKSGTQNGQIIIVSGELTLSNCTLAYNFAGGVGGGANCEPDPNVPARLTVHNSISWFNVAQGGGAHINGPATVSYSNVQGGFAGAGNIAANPQFVNPAALNYDLAANSPSIDAGSPQFHFEDRMDVDQNGDFCEPTPLDLRGSPRVVGASIDIGAFERQ